MRVTDRAIVLQTIRHGDRQLIIKLYTREHGLLTAIAAAGRSASSKVRAGNLMPLSLLNTEITVKQNKEIHRLTEAASYHVHSNIHASLPRLTIAQFLNEVLIKCLKEQQNNPTLFDFIETCLRYLDDPSADYINLHLYFLGELSKYLGFEPQNNYSEHSRYFDCREGRFSGVSLAFPLGLGEADSRLFSEFLRIDPLSAGMSQATRQNLLEILLAYYRLHVPAFGQVRSLGVLKEVMAG